MNSENIEKDFKEQLAEQVFQPGNFTETDSTIEFDCIAISSSTINRTYGKLVISSEELQSSVNSMVGVGVYPDHDEVVENMVGGVKSAEYINDGYIKARLQIVKTKDNEKLVALIKLNPSPIRYVSSTFTRDVELINTEFSTPIYKAKNIEFYGIALVFQAADKNNKTQLGKNMEENMPPEPGTKSAAPGTTIEKQPADLEKLSADLSAAISDREALSAQVGELKSDAALGKQYREKLSANVKKYVGLVEGDTSPILSLVQSASVETLEQLADQYGQKAREKMARSAQPTKKELGSELTVDSLERMSYQELVDLSKTERFASVDSSTNPEFFPKYYQRVLLTNLLENIVTDRYGKDAEIPVNSGKTIHWKRIPIPDASTTPITNQATPAGSSVTSESVEATLNEYGHKWTLDSFADLTSYYPLAKEIADKAAIHGQRTIEALNLKAIIAGTSVKYAGAVEDRDSLDGTKKLSKAFFREVWAQMDNAGVPTMPDGNYVCFINPDKLNDVFTDDDLIKFSAAKPETAAKGYIGVWSNIVFVTCNSSNLKTTNTSGKTVYLSPVIGLDAYGKVGLENNRGVKLTYGDTDDMHRVKSIGWLVYYAAKILEDDRVIRCESN